uniref:Uncharacterized protein n=1 Tax=Glossina austeni TaxID=7395 RepID=A0A1A9UT52_GLOAU
MADDVCQCHTIYWFALHKSQKTLVPQNWHVSFIIFESQEVKNCRIDNAIGHADECNTGIEFRAITLPKIIASRKEQSPASNKGNIIPFIKAAVSCNEFICVSRPRIMPLYCATSADASELRL